MQEKKKISLMTLFLSMMTISAFTFGGGLQGLHEFWAGKLDGLPYGVALIISVMLVSGAVDLPLSLYAQFVIEEKFGFNRMTLGLFFLDLVKQALFLGGPAFTSGGAHHATPEILDMWRAGQLVPSRGESRKLVAIFVCTLSAWPVPKL